MFSDRYRAGMVPLLTLFLIALMGWWSWLQHDGQIGFSRMMKRPGSVDGQQVVLSLVEVTAITATDRFEVERGSAHFEVKGPTTGLVVGEEVSVGGVFHANGSQVDQAWLVHATMRPWKRRLGYAGLVVLAGMLAVGVRRQGRELVVHG